MSNVSNIVKTIQDIMRKDAGTYGDVQRLEQLGWMFFLKIFDDREKELELFCDDYKSPLSRYLRWSAWASDDRHMFGDIYEKLLKDLQVVGNVGEFYTPRAVTQFIVEQINPRLGESILDPACGTGGFLVCAIDHLHKQAKTSD